MLLNANYLENHFSLWIFNQQTRVALDCRANEHSNLTLFLMLDGLSTGTDAAGAAETLAKGAK